MKKGIKLMVLSAIVTFGMFAATISANACWVFSMYQREMPKSLIKED